MAECHPAIGRRIAAKLAASGMTRKLVRHRARISKAYLSNLEAGRYVPSVAVLVRLAKAMGCRASELLGEGP